MCFLLLLQHSFVLPLANLIAIFYSVSLFYSHFLVFFSVYRDSVWRITQWRLSSSKLAIQATSPSLGLMKVTKPLSLLHLCLCPSVGEAVCNIRIVGDLKKKSKTNDWKIQKLLEKKQVWKDVKKLKSSLVSLTVGYPCTSSDWRHLTLLNLFEEEEKKCHMCSRFGTMDGITVIFILWCVATQPATASLSCRTEDGQPVDW